MLEIIQNYRDNVRNIYEEPEISIYNEDYFKKQCGGFEAFNLTNGKELDGSRQFVLNLQPLQAHYSALDIGCGRGELVYALARLGLRQVVGIDISEDSVRISKEVCAKQISEDQVKIQKMSAINLEFDDTLFDIIYMTDVVEHLSDSNLRLAIAEAYRVLKPGGQLVIHTLPTVNYKLYGQYLTKYYLKLQGRHWWTPTAKEESLLGHVNIQSKISLESYIYQLFKPENTNVFYASVNSKTFLKRIVGYMGLWKIMSPHLWAVATK